MFIKSVIGLALVTAVGCAGSLEKKCFELEVGEEGRINAPSTAWFAITLGDVEGPVKLKSCPVPTIIESVPSVEPLVVLPVEPASPSVLPEPESSE